MDYVSLPAYDKHGGKYQMFRSETGTWTVRDSKYSLIGSSSDFDSAVSMAFQHSHSA